MKKQLDKFAAEVIENPTKCPQCGAVTQFNHGTCINCFLREGIEAKGEGSRETFESVLLEANVTDTQWRLGHYEILEEIGRGGMGVIYRARQQHSRRIVAVKRILAHQVNSHEMLVRFRREAEAVASLDHPNILPIYEVSESKEGLPFFSMKYAEGGSLRTAAPALRAKPRECVRLMAKVARAIAYAHGKGVLHRDLQPGNVLLDQNGEPMVSDFGLAKWLDQSSDLTRTLETLGTPGYIAPEQAECRAGELTSAADTYSLGAILFYLLTGRPPFVGPNVLFVIHQAAATPAPLLRSLAPSLDRDLETIVAHCLEPDPNARYQSAGALADDLEHWLRHEPIQARRSGIFTRGRKWVRRNPTSTVLVASLIALATAIGVMFWGTESSHTVPTADRSISYKSIAVLPFKNLSADPENAFFADGVQDEILNDVAKIADLKVISRTSVMQYKTDAKRNLPQIANELGVAHIVEGSVQRAGNRVRITAQLIDAKTDTHVWGEGYDRSLDDVFAIQSEIAKAIANQLKAKLSPAEKSAIEQPPTKNLIAYDRYLRAKKVRAVQTARVPADMREEIRLLDQAVAYDPTFLLAYCELAQAHAYAYHLGVDRTPAGVALAKAARDAALRLGPDRGEPHLAAAWVAKDCDLDYETALSEVAIARRKLPNDASVFALPAYIHRRQGHWENCASDLERAVQLDPRNVWLLQDAAETYHHARQFPEAATAWDRVLAVAPGDPSTRVWRALVDLDSRADVQPAHEAIQNIVIEDPSAVDSIAEHWLYLTLCRRDAAEIGRALASLPPEGIVRRDLLMPRSFCEGLAARTRGDAKGADTAFTAARAEMEKVVQEQPDYAQAFCVLGMSDAALGRKEDAIREGRRAVELLPVTKDMMAGGVVLANLAIIYAWAGEKDLALEQLATAIRFPSPEFLSYGQLKLHPFWDPLRGDPRFEKLLEESKKPVSLESRQPLPAGIAVLPFENLSADTENAFFADGVQDEILNNLAKIADLKVISRTSVMQYKTGEKRNLRQIANELGVVHVVEGSVQRAGGRVRVSAQLIDAKTDTHLWAESYDRSLDDVFAIQSAIAKAIADQLQAKVSPKTKSAIEERPTRDLHAYDLYVRAKLLVNAPEISPDNYLEAARLLDHAIARDPDFFLAYCLLAEAHSLHYLVFDHTPARRDLADRAVKAALHLRPEAGEAHLERAGYLYRCDLDYDNARAELTLAQRKLPNNAKVFELMAFIDRRQGRSTEAVRNLEKAVELDPRNLSNLWQLARTYLDLRRSAELAVALDRAQALEPQDSGAGAQVFRAWWVDLNCRADPEPLHKIFEALINENPAVAQDWSESWIYLALCERDPVLAGRALSTMTDAFNRDGLHFSFTLMKACVARAFGDDAAARKAFTVARTEVERTVREQPDYGPPLCLLGLIDAGLGRKEEAIREGRRASELTPVTKDAMTGANIMQYLSIIYAWTGEKDLAIEQIAATLQVPSFLSYGELRLHPFWDPLRGDPRFEKLVEEAKKPVVLNSL